MPWVLQNLERGKGLLCRSLMRSQLASPTYTAVFASLVAVINSKFPDIGLLLASRVVLQFKRAYRRSDRPVAIAAIKFIAHLVNQQVRFTAVAPSKQHAFARLSTASLGCTSAQGWPELSHTKCAVAATQCL